MPDRMLAAIFKRPRQVVVEEVGLPLLSVFEPARKAFEETGARDRGVRLLVSGESRTAARSTRRWHWVRRGGRARGARVAMGCTEEAAGNCHTG
jgi:glutamate synthase domain-containing protein 2